VQAARTHGQHRRAYYDAYGYAAYGCAGDFNDSWADEGHWPRAENEHERAAQRWHEERWCAHYGYTSDGYQDFSGGQADEDHWQRAEAENERAAQRWQDARAAEERAHAAEERRVPRRRCSTRS